MHSPLTSFLADLIQSHGYVVEDVSITNDSARCMLPGLCLSNGEDRACDTEEQNGPPLKSPPSFDMALADSIVVDIKKLSRWESVTSGGIAARPNNMERKGSPVTVVIGLKGSTTSITRTRPSAGISNRKTSSDATLSLPERKESMDNFSCHNARESPPKQNASFYKPKSGSPKWPNQAKKASALARAILFDQC
jgi:hypothetical protein